MKRYFISQLKRGLRLVPGLILVAALLFACLGTAFTFITRSQEEEVTTRFQIGMVGAVGDSYLELAIAALQMMDATRFSLELVSMDAEAAETALEKGKIAAYVVIPEGFMEAAFSGTILPIDFVSAANAANFTTFIKEEITTIVSDIVLSSQKGSFGISNALTAAGNGHLAGKHTGKASVEYVKYVLDRGKVYQATSLGISSALSFYDYLLCGLSVLLFLLCSLPFAPYLIKKDFSLEQLLCIRHCTPAKQLLCEWFVFFLYLLIPAELLLLVINQIHALPSYAFLMAFPAFFALSSMSFFLFQLSRDLVSGILLPFFVSIALAFVSGCMYPVYFFPILLQKLSVYLPTGLARTQLSYCFTGEALPETGFALLLYGIGFFALSVLLRRKRLQGGAL